MLSHLKSGPFINHFHILPGRRSAIAMMIMRVAEFCSLMMTSLSNGVIVSWSLKEKLRYTASKAIFSLWSQGKATAFIWGMMSFVLQDQWEPLWNQDSIQALSLPWEMEGTAWERVGESVRDSWDNICAQWRFCSLRNGQVIAKKALIELSFIALLTFCCWKDCCHQDHWCCYGRGCQEEGSYERDSEEARDQWCGQELEEDECQGLQVINITNHWNAE